MESQRQRIRRLPQPLFEYGSHLAVARRSEQGLAGLEVIVGLPVRLAGRRKGRGGWLLLERGGLVCWNLLFALLGIAAWNNRYLVASLANF